MKWSYALVVCGSGLVLWWGWRQLAISRDDHQQRLLNRKIYELDRSRNFDC